MDAAMEKLCAEKHKNIEAKFEVNDKRLDNHGDRLDKLEGGQVRTETIVNNLCKQLENLTTAIWWFLGIILTTGVGFIIWYIQSLPII